MSTISIERKTIVSILASKIKSKPEVAEQVANYMVSNMTYSMINVLLNLLSKDEPMVIPKEGDYIMTKIPYNHDKTIFDKDILEELGLLVKNKIFGVITGKGGYFSSEDGSYCSEFKTNLFYHDENKKLIKYEKTIGLIDIEVIDKKQIPYFNGDSIKNLYEQRLDNAESSEEEL